MTADPTDYARSLGLDHEFAPGTQHPQFCGALEGTCGWGESLHEPEKHRDA